MKKIIKKFLLLFLISIPLNINAQFEGISNYYIETTVLDNGDLKVKEMFVLEGDFNGYERVINFKNLNAKIFDGSNESFNGNHLHNGDSINVLNVKSIAIDNNVNFKYLYKDGDEFTKHYPNTVNKGEYQKYIEEETAEGVKLKIFNPSTFNKRGFYIEYILKNMAILHNDVGEVGWNLFSNLQQEPIKKIEMYINIPHNQDEVRVWGHGPLNGEVDIINKNKLKYTLTDLPSQTAIDIRFVFDKDVIVNSNKKSNAEALEKIIHVETVKADKANEEREEALKTITRQIKISNIARMMWFIGLIAIVYHVYKKYDKEYDSDFKTKYFRDFPNDYNPPMVSYLMNKKIGTKEMSATILNFVANKKIKYEEIKKNKFEFIKNINDEEFENLSESEQALVTMLFNNIGDGTRVSIDDINKTAKRNYNKFLNDYNRWKDLTILEAKKEALYEKNSGIKTLTIIYILLGLTFHFKLPKYDFFANVGVLYQLFYILIVLCSAASLIYVISFTKRTKKGNEYYRRWNGLKNFLNDFGKFEARDLPHIELWEKYLVYAVVFGVAKKLSKTMEIKFKEMPKDNYTASDYIFDTYYWRNLNRINESISTGVSNAVNTALSTKTLSETRTSSGGGLGGGFSGGGGSFGGGGGGGRF